MDLSGKLTIKHFLYIDTRKTKGDEKQKAKSKASGKEKSKIDTSKNKYPVYLRISLDKKQFDIKSEFQNFLLNKNKIDPQALSEINSFTEKEFESITNSNINEIAKAIEAEAKATWDVSNYLRLNKFNIAKKGAKVILLEFITPIEDAINKTCLPLLRNSLYTSKDLANSRSVIGIIDWSQDFQSIFNGLEDLSKESISHSILQKFKFASDLLILLADFTKTIVKNKNQNTSNSKDSVIHLVDNKILVYQWNYYDLKSKFREYLIKKSIEKHTIDEYIAIVDLAISNEIQHDDLANLKKLMFPFPEKKPKLSVS